MQIAALVLVALWAIFQCFWHLGAANINQDELLYANAGWQYVHGDFHLNREHPPTAKYLFGIAQLIGGQGVQPARVIVALAVLAGGTILFLWLRRELGWWGALIAAGLWWLMPRSGLGLRADRVAILDPMMTFFLIAALAAGWVWMRSGRWWWLPVSATLMAMSVTSKISTIVVVPVFLLLPILFRRPMALLWGGLVWAGTFALVFVGTYLPMGLVDAIRYMITLQQKQQTHGHIAPIAGDHYRFAPWWGNLWYLADGVTVPVVIVLALGTVLALVLRPGKLVFYIAVGLALILTFYLGFAKIALSTYYYPFTPFLVILTAIGFTRLLALKPRAIFTTITVLALLTAAAPAAGLSARIAQSRPSGIALVQTALTDAGATRGRVLFQSYTPFGYEPYFGTNGTMKADEGPFRAIVIGRDSRFPVDVRVTALLHDHRDKFTRQTFDGLELWIPINATITDEPTRLLLTEN